MNYINSKPLPRRLILRGMGATMALPFMEAMAQSKKTASASKLAHGPDGQPIRYAAIFMPNGVTPNQFTPPGSTLDKLSPILSPLGKMAKRVNVITGMETSFGGHAASTSSFLTGQKPSSERRSNEVNIVNASVDQIIGDAAKGTCAFPTLELAMHTPRKGISPSGLPWTYGNCISWKNATTPVPQEVNPMRAFLRLFENAQLSSSPSKKKKPTAFVPNRSVVDLVLEDAKQLERRLGKNDSQKLDEYLTNVREVESRIFKVEQAVGLNINEEILTDIQATEKKFEKHSKSSKLSALPKIPYPVYMELMMDVMALAFWSNSTRASTLMLGDGASRINMSFLEGVSGAHHSISHHGNDPAKLKQYTLICQFFIKQYTYFLNRLSNMKEGSNSVLDNSLVMLGSGISNGQFHSKKDIPVILGGTAGGKIKTNRHIKAPNRTSVGSLHRSVLDIMNIDSSVIQGKGGGLKGI